MRVIGIIPVRLDSARLPEKALLPINGKPMVMHVYEGALSCDKLERVLIATDSEKIFNTCTSYGAEVIMTGRCSSGTERVFSALDGLHEDYEVVINIQGDEPLIRASHISALIELFESKDTQIGTLAEPLRHKEENEDPNTVKLIFNKGKEVLDFTRSPILETNKHKHIGLYAFKVSLIPELLKIQMTERRRLESLEQLDWLLNGYKIYANIIDGGLISVDTQADLRKVRGILEEE